jgi:hypothetical protein
MSLMVGWRQVERFRPVGFRRLFMSALPRIAKAPDGQGVSATNSPAASSTRFTAIDIPPPIPTAPATREQVRASLELGLAEARAGIGEDFEVVQARLRAKFFPSSR